MEHILFESGEHYEKSGSLGLTCGDQHYWTWAGDPNMELSEGFPCACGRMLWHKETCASCGQSVVRPISR